RGSPQGNRRRNWLCGESGESGKRKVFLSASSFTLPQVIFQRYYHSQQQEIMTAMTPGSSVCFLQVLLVVCLFYFLALGSSSAVEALEVAVDAGKPLEDDGDSYMTKRQHYRMIRDIAEDPSALRSLIRDLLNEAASKQKPR
ncbi:unnamed protein product, partial [Cyprideis torosa]